jgi:hypothetical protein
VRAAVELAEEGNHVVDVRVDELGQTIERDTAVSETETNPGSPDPGVGGLTTSAL